jgi:mitotic spindle assembly checkpoint protein MAD2
MLTLRAKKLFTDPKYINNQQEVRLRSFSTKVHKIDAMVAYKADD